MTIGDIRVAHNQSNCNSRFLNVTLDRDISSEADTNRWCMCVTEYLSDPGSTLFYFSLVVWWQIRGDRFYGVRGQMHLIGNNN